MRSDLPPYILQIVTHQKLNLWGDLSEIGITCPTSSLYNFLFVPICSLDLVKLLHLLVSDVKCFYIHELNAANDYLESFFKC